MIYDFVLTNENIFPIEKMFEVLEIGFIGTICGKSACCLKKIGKVLLISKKQINVIYFSSKQLYGGARITAQLTFFGYKISRITVAKYIREMALSSKLSREFKITTDSNDKYNTMATILKYRIYCYRAFGSRGADITYISTKEGFLCLTAVIDLYDRKIIEWSLSNGMIADETYPPEQVHIS
jgi:putative transposase